MKPEDMARGIHEIPNAEQNPADGFLEHNIRSLLGDEIVDFWRTQTKNWTQRFAIKNLSELASAVGDIPQAKATNDQEATPLINFKLEHWMIGSNINVAGNLAIALATETLHRTKKKATVATMLKTIGGAQARINWERKHELNLKKIAAQAPELHEKLLKNENDRYNSPLNKLQYIQRSQTRFVKARARQAQEPPQEFRSFLDRKNRLAIRRFNHYSALTQTVVGRDDGKNFVIRFESGPWTQAALVEEHNLNFSEPKGISVTFYRYNETTGEKEFFVCYGKRDAFTRTHQLTPAWQTSMTRVKTGNHPGQEYNPMLASLKDAFSRTQSGNGVEISYIDPNPNRNDESPIAIATIDWASYSPEDQEQILKVMVQENNGKSLLHSWIPESKIAILRRRGMMDMNGDIAPGVNGFLAISLGSRSPKEILQDGANRLAYRLSQQLLSANQDVTPEMIETATERLLESPETEQVGVLVRSLLLILTMQSATHQRITAEFPHTSHQLNSTNRN